MTSFPTRTDSQEMKTQGVCLDWTKGGMLKLDYFPEVENMVEWVMLTRCKMLEFTNTLSRECTGLPVTCTSCAEQRRPVLVNSTCALCAVSVAADHRHNVTTAEAAVP